MKNNAGLEVPLTVHGAYPLRTLQHTYHAKPLNIFFNDHMNNVEYLYWLFDPFEKKWMDEHEIKSLTIHYKGEAFEEDILKSDVEKRDEQTLHKVYIDGSDKSVIIANIDWQKRNKP